MFFYRRQFNVMLVLQSKTLTVTKCQSQTRQAKLLICLSAFRRYHAFTYSVLKFLFGLCAINSLLTAVFTADITEKVLGTMTADCCQEIG